MLYSMSVLWTLYELLKCQKRKQKYKAMSFRVGNLRPVF